MFTNLKIFGDLKNLETLILSQNKIETLYASHTSETIIGLRGLPVTDLNRI